MADLDELGDEINQKLQLVDVAQLGECCVQLGITIPPAKRGKKSAIKALILMHVCSNVQQDDNAEEILTALNTTLNGMVQVAEEKEKDVVVDKKETEEKPKVEEESVGTSGSATNNGGEQQSNSQNNAAAAAAAPLAGAHGGNVVTNTTRVELSRFKEFKVSPGTFGGEKHVDYTSLCYQIEDAKELKYTSREIVSGMIKSMKQPLKKYCEGKRNWSLEKLMAHIRSYAKVATSEEVMDQMKQQSQKPDQEEGDYLVQMCAIRDDVIAMTKQEENPMDERRIEKNFLRALLAGFRKDTIRLMLTPLLKQSNLDDQTLMDEVNEAVRAEAESKKKNKSGGKGATTNSLDAECGESEPVLSAFEARMVKELSKITGKMDELECKVNSIGSGGSGSADPSDNDKKPFKFIKCAPCEKEGRYCKHCSLCGKMGHKRQDCKDAAGKV